VLIVAARNETRSNRPSGAKIATQPSMFMPTTRPDWTWKNRLASSGELNRPKATMPDRASPEAM
jgi:hypothetical protein